MTDMRKNISSLLAAALARGLSPLVYGDDNVGPYLKDVLKDVYTVNFYNHDDYALNIWVMNNTSKPDNLRGVGTRDTSFSCSPVVDEDTTYVFKCEKWERDGFFWGLFRHDCGSIRAA